jgi:hypothetical protein
MHRMLSFEVRIQFRVATTIGSSLLQRTSIHVRNRGRLRIILEFKLKYKITVFQQFALKDINNMNDMPVVEIHKLQCHH